MNSQVLRNTEIVATRREICAMNPCLELLSNIEDHRPDAQARLHAD
jgi:hypothetical protein